MSAPQLRAIATAELPAWQRRLAAFERGFDYPLGDDRFRIDHGADYAAFFRRLGAPTVVIATDDDDVVGVLVAVRREHRGRRSWYLCDLKVTRRSGATRTGVRLLQRWAADRLADDDAVFGVSMDPADGDNRLVRTARRCREAQPLETTPLAIFSVDHATWRRCADVVQRRLGPVTFLDLRGVKDLVLRSTGRRMPLLHAQHGPWATPAAGPPREDHVHMFCLPAADPLAAELSALGVAPAAAATVLHRHAAWIDWRHLLTSDI